MLNGLSSDFDPMVMAIESSGADITSDFVKGKLLQEDVKRSKENTSSDGGAFYTRNREKKDFKDKKKDGLKFKKDFRCFVCNEKGHRALNCPKNTNKPNAKKSFKESEKKNDDLALLTALSANIINKDDWYIDSGATIHMTKWKDWLTNYNPTMKKEIICANDTKLFSAGVGDLTYSLNHKQTATMNEVIYVLNLSTNLLSVSTMVKRNLIVTFTVKGCQIYDKSDCRIRGSIKATAREEGVYKLDRMTEKANVAIQNSDKALWHRRLGHLGNENLKLLRDEMTTGINFKEEILSQCVHCLKGKQTRQSFKNTNAQRASEILELVHTDISGPMKESSWGGARYFMTVIDDKTRKTFVYFLKSKDEVKSKLKDFKILAENQTGKRLRIVRSDNGKEYTNHYLTDFFRRNGIRHQLTVEYTPEQNGVAERANRTIVEKARSMLQEAGLDSKYWAEAVNTAVYLKNRSPTKAVRGMTPEEAWTGKNLKYLRVFGSKAHVHVPKQLRTKWDSKSKEMIFVGYCEDSKAYRLMDKKKSSMQNPKGERCCLHRD